jgi:DNA-binding FadR family transcriptional regulator
MIMANVRAATRVNLAAGATLVPVAAHPAIADAIIAGDAALAQHRMLRHLTALAAQPEP